MIIPAVMCKSYLVRTIDYCTRGLSSKRAQNSDDWNERFQKALYLPEETDDDCYLKWQRLTTVNRDFVATAVTYGKTIISEYFLKDSDKSIQ